MGCGGAVARCERGVLHPPQDGDTPSVAASPNPCEVRPVFTQSAGKQETLLFFCISVAYQYSGRYISPKTLPPSHPPLTQSVLRIRIGISMDLHSIQPLDPDPATSIAEN